MIPWLILAAVWLFAAHLTIEKHGVEAAPILVFLLIVVLLGSGGGVSARQ